MAKYILTDETIEYNGHTLHRIQNINTGQLGGWIESEYNLSQEGMCWVDNEAKVFGNARVFEDAVVNMNARIYGTAEIYGRANISNNAQVYNEASVYDNAVINGSAKISGNAKVYNNAIITDNAKVYGHSKVFDDAVLRDQAHAYDVSVVYGKSYLCGESIVGGTAKIFNQYQSYSTVGIKTLCKQTIFDLSLYTDIQYFYESIDILINDTSDSSKYNLEDIIIAVDKDIEQGSRIMFRKSISKNKIIFKLNIYIRTDYGDIYTVSYIVNDIESVKQYIKAAVSTIQDYPRFSVYAKDFNLLL